MQVGYFRNFSPFLNSNFRTLIISKYTNANALRYLATAFYAENRFADAKNISIIGIKFRMANGMTYAVVATVLIGTFLYKYFKGDNRRIRDRSYYRSVHPSSYDTSYYYYPPAVPLPTINYPIYNDYKYPAYSLPSVQPKPKRRRGKRNKKNKNNDECTICLNILNNGTKKLSCGHIFHTNCITRWFVEDRSCPICRRDMY